MKQIFIDGRAGTTGLRIEERLRTRADVRLLTLPESRRRDRAARQAMLNQADVAFLCLPDAAAREAVALVENPATVIIDASTAHRTAPGWCYGFPELGASFRQSIQAGKRTAVPGCHASGFVALVYPLIQAGLLEQNAQMSCFSITGYSGGGKGMIAEYESGSRTANDPLQAPRQYALGQVHKHLPEMQAVTGLETAPLFCPAVADYDCGMEVTVPLHAGQMSAFYRNAAQLLDCYQKHYAGQALVQIGVAEEPAFLSANAMRGRDSIELAVGGNDERLLLIARFDNLGKGASGAAVQCLNLALGAEETAGLVC
ncbi:MAG: N-acetyl-gamma-glutamyl-phosphate reductase [Oscillospiraceae bacterium]|jgi:N-acetyl-gamma-glutamyl-phosphate reductase|nr:N-acetyl-gamma-glutamyl-phosphate reductase [Oscillospiraceae bacterium]